MEKQDLKESILAEYLDKAKDFSKKKLLNEVADLKLKQIESANEIKLIKIIHETRRH